MDLAHAFYAAHLASRADEHAGRATASSIEVATAEFRAVTRARVRAERAARADWYTERGRHRAPAMPSARA